jgi:hypothetical protein
VKVTVRGSILAADINSINGGQVTPTIIWADPADITVGTPLDFQQLDAFALVSGTSVLGTFTYNPPAGTILNAGANQPLMVTFTPYETTDYTGATKTVYINVDATGQRTPIITWGNPADISYGTALGAVQLDASANVLGTFAYTPAAGIVLPVGNGQVLSVVFTPFDTVDYKTVMAHATINVAEPPPLVTVSSVRVVTVHLTRKKTASEIVIAFTGALDPADADNLGNYRLAAPGKGKKSRTYSKIINLVSAVYAPASDQVTLRPGGKLALRPAPQLRIIAAGLLDPLGRELDGNNDGQPGGDYVADLTGGGAQAQILRGAEMLARRPPQFPARH